jgi:hypothetical protein
MCLTMTLLQTAEPQQTKRHFRTSSLAGDGFATISRFLFDSAALLLLEPVQMPRLLGHFRLRSVGQRLSIGSNRGANSSFYLVTLKCYE